MKEISPESGRVGAGFRDGDPAAAQEVRERVRRILSFRGYRIPREERRDLEQIVMAQLWQAAGRDGFDPGAGFWGFVEVVASRRCVDWLRTRREEVPLEATMAESDLEADPLGQALRQERRELARTTLARLPEGCRELIRLQLELNKSYAEAAAILGKSEGALRVQMHRCIKRAQRILRGIEDGPEP